MSHTGFSSINPLKMLKRGEGVRVMIVGKGGRHLRMGDLIKVDEMIVDYAKDKSWGPIGNHAPHFDGKGTPFYILHDETGAIIDIELDESVLKLKTDASLMFKLTNKEMLKNMLQQSPPLGMLILTAIASFFAGGYILGSL